MKREIYDLHIEQEERHWWFKGRRHIVNALLGRIAFAPNAQLLEAGCGSGGNLPMLSRYGAVKAFEMDDAMRAHASARAVCPVEPGSLPGAIPFGDETFDLIALFDVLEHVEEDAASLAALYARTKPGGYLLLTVPAFPILFGPHDIDHHHKRRYTMRGLKRRVADAGFTPLYANHYNFWLFPVAALVRLWERFFPRPGHAIGGSFPAPAINHFLYRLMASESHLMRCVSLPLGTSIILLAQKPGA